MWLAAAQVLQQPDSTGLRSGPCWAVTAMQAGQQYLCAITLRAPLCNSIMAVQGHCSGQWGACLLAFPSCRMVPAASSWHVELLGRKQVQGQQASRRLLQMAGAQGRCAAPACHARSAERAEREELETSSSSSSSPLVVFQLPFRACHALPELVLHGCLGLLPPGLDTASC